MKKYTGNVVNRPEISGSDFKGYFVPETVEEAIDVLADKGEELEILAGGTDLLVDYHEQLYKVPGWLDIRLLDELKKIECNNDKIEIGAAVTHVQLEESELINDKLPLISQAAAEVGSPQIRSRGTIGGNIVTASPAGDLLPPLLVYEAEFEILSRDGKERIPAAEFFVGPKESAIKPDQLLTKIILPEPDVRTYGSFIKIGKRKALAISTLSLALVVELDNDNKIKEVRIALGAVAPTPLAVPEVKEKMKGMSPSELDYDQIAELITDKISPIDDIRGTKEYRYDTTYSLAKQVLESLEQEVKGSEDNPDS